LLPWITIPFTTNAGVLSIPIECAAATAAETGPGTGLLNIVHWLDGLLPDSDGDGHTDSRDQCRSDRIL
jgi:hypothetical protein